MNNTRYWLKGGIISVSAALAVLLFYVLAWVPLFTDNLLFFLILIAPAIVTLLPLTLISEDCYFPGFMGSPYNCPIGETTYTALIFIASVVGYFILGALIGFLYKKYKKI